MNKINFKNGESGGTPINANNLNLMQDNIENAVNDSIETITNDYGTAIKFPDGTMECMGQITFNATFNAWGNLYGADYTTPKNFPVPFIETPKIVATNTGGNASMITRISASKDAVTYLGIARPNVSNSWYYIDYKATGRWK